MTESKSRGTLLFPARTYIVDAAVVHPVLPFVQALIKEKFRVVSEPGQSPVKLRYGALWKDLLAGSEYFPGFLLPKKLQRWELTVDVRVTAGIDPYGNHAVTATGWSVPRRGNNFLFETLGAAADSYAQSGHLLHVSDYFEGDASAFKKSKPSK